MTPAHKVIYTHGGGRLGNQILRFLHWIAWARQQEGQVEVLNLSFWPYAEYFATWSVYPACIFPVRGSRADGLARTRAALPRRLRELGENRNRLQRAVQAVSRWWPGCQAFALDDFENEKTDLGDPTFFARVAQSRVTVCSGWEYASWRLVGEQQAELRDLFRPAEKYARPARDFMAKLRLQHDVVAGLAIRHGDYATWDGGRFFFPVACYVQWVRQLTDLFPGRRVAVVITSETRQDPACFAGLPCYFATGVPGEGGHWFESWVELSLCDFVLSPPSTFAATAVFGGGVPLWPVVTANQVLRLDQCLSDGMVAASRDPLFGRSVR